MVILKLVGITNEGITKFLDSITKYGITNIFINVQGITNRSINPNFSLLIKKIYERERAYSLWLYFSARVREWVAGAWLRMGSLPIIIKRDGVFLGHFSFWPLVIPEV